MHYHLTSSDALCDFHTPVSRPARTGTEVSHTGAGFSSANETIDKGKSNLYAAGFSANNRST
jgi:hypothetical protein